MRTTTRRNCGRAAAGRRKTTPVGTSWRPVVSEVTKRGETPPAAARQLRLLRQTRGWSQPYLARQLDTSRQQISKLEKGQARLTVEWINRLAAALEVSPQRFFEDVEPAAPEAETVPQSQPAGPPAAQGVHGLGNGRAATPMVIDNDDYTLVPQYDVRATQEGLVEERARRGDWPFAAPYLRHVLGVQADNLAMIEVIGDSMATTLEAGDRLLVDVADRRPSPPGIFVIWDGDGTVVKRLERLPNTDPPLLSIMSDNPRYASYQRPVDDAVILGRVVWYARRL